MKPQPTGQTGCKARLLVCSNAAGVWKITGVHLGHNHLTSPTKSRAFRCYRQLNAHVKRQLEVNDIAGIPLHKSYNSVVVKVGGYEKMTFIEKDCRNYIDKVRKLRLGEGDAAAIQAYFSKMQSLSPGFFFRLDLDGDGRLKNIFWADNRCRQAYKEFGDVVTFDTTYLTNKYDMPFAPFIGVNHHGHSTLLGFGLLSSEDTETFVWLFRIWLECMEFKSPQGIITDQDRAMQNAIEAAFPNSKHRWCLWHILKKLPEKFGYHCQKASILSSVHELVYESQSTNEFEHGWFSMLDMYDLQNNDWLIGLFREKTRWVPCFLITSFRVGMSTTQRSESMNSFFDGYVHSKTSLKQFVEQYERALRSKVEKEFQADFKSFSQLVPCVTQFDIERHAIAVLIRNKCSVVLEQYILRRWRKDVSRLYMRVKINYNGWLTTPGQLNYERLCEAFTNIADMAADNDEETQKLLEWIESKASDLAISKLRSGCSRTLVSPQSMQVQSDHVDDTTQVSMTTCKVLDPKYTKTEGAPKKLRKKGPLEKCSKKSKVLVKSSKGKNFQPKNIEYNNVIIQSSVENSVMNPIAFSQQLMKPNSLLNVEASTMAAAYAALMSLLNTLELILHPSQQWLRINKTQIKSLLQKVRFLQEFLEDYSHRAHQEMAGVENQIAAKANVADDIIESYVFHQIGARSTSRGAKASTRFSQFIHTFTEEMEDLIENNVMRIKETIGKFEENPTFIDFSPSVASRSAPMVGSHEKLEEYWIYSLGNNQIAKS
ncbi:protein FAR1-RELATED SEQUENCE 5-like [Henckelia pumila]|uniref:protein FAR1-RELATED SEQUENCE 5-like n=1 Tax=Henckelia pumila TaxID=405737 RepID=UPI003C6E1C3C